MAEAKAPRALGLHAAAFLGVSSVAAFYGFYEYLAAVGTPEAWRGFCIGLEPLAAFLVRPIVAPRLTAANAPAAMRLGLAGLCLILPGYLLFPSPLCAALLRLAHGTFFAVFFSGLAAAFVRTIPANQSGRAFGNLFLATLLPYAVIPALIGFFAGAPDQTGQVYAATSLLLIPAFFLAGPSRRPPGTAPAAATPARRGLAPALALPGLRLLLIANLFLITAQMAVFFFLKPFASGLGLAEPELFFTIMTVSCLTARLFGAPFFDRLDKRKTAMAAVLVTAVSYAGLALCREPVLFFVLAAPLGLCSGVIAPMLNSLAYLSAPDDLRGLCVNLMLSTLDAGLFLGPWLAGGVLALGLPFRDIFVFSAICPLFALACLAAFKTSSPVANGDITL